MMFIDLNYKLRIFYQQNIGYPIEVIITDDNIRNNKQHYQVLRMKIDLDQYQSTGQQRHAVIELGSKSLKSIEWYRLYNHLLKQPPNWLQNFIIKNDEIVFANGQHSLHIDLIPKAQFVLHSNQSLHDSITNIHIDVKDESVLNYFVDNLGYEKAERVQKKLKAVETKKFTAKAFQDLTLKEKERKKKIRQRMNFLKNRKAKMGERKEREKQKLASEDNLAAKQ